MANYEDSAWIQKAINARVKLEVNKIIDEEMEQVVDKVRQRVANITDEIALNVLQHYDISQDKHMIYINVKKDV